LWKTFGTGRQSKVEIRRGGRPRGHSSTRVNDFEPMAEGLREASCGRLRTRGFQLFPVRGTSGDLRHPRCSRYRCSLPGLAGFAGPRCTEPEAPRSGSRCRTTAGIQFNTPNARDCSTAELPSGRGPGFFSGATAGNRLSRENPARN